MSKVGRLTNAVLEGSMQNAYEAGFAKAIERVSSGLFSDDDFADLQEKCWEEWGLLGISGYDPRENKDSGKTSSRGPGRPPATPSPKKPEEGPHLAEKEYDPEFCRARFWNAGDGGQCWRKPCDGDDHCKGCGVKRDNPEKNYWGCFDEPHGSDSEHKSNGGSHPWKILEAGRAEKKDSAKKENKLKEKKMAKEKKEAEKAEKKKAEKEEKEAKKKAEKEEKDAKKKEEKEEKDEKKKAEEAEKKAEEEKEEAEKEEKEEAEKEEKDAKKKEEKEEKEAEAEKEEEKEEAEKEEKDAEKKEEKEEKEAEAEKEEAEAAPIAEQVALLSEEEEGEMADIVEEDTESLSGDENDYKEEKPLDVFEAVSVDLGDGEDYELKWNKQTNELLDPDDDDKMGMMILKGDEWVPEIDSD
jgi:hypothetical protein